MKHFALVLVVCLSIAALAQAPAPPKPGPEIQKLGYFVGTWTADLDIKPGLFGSGGKTSFIEHNEWFHGGFFLITHSDGNLPGAGPVKGLAIMSYDAEKKQYVYREVNSMGMQEDATGQLDGNTWHWLSEMNMGGKTLKERYTVKQESATTYFMKFESSEDGVHWTTLMEGTAKKTAAPAQPPNSKMKKPATRPK